MKRFALGLEPYQDIVIDTSNKIELLNLPKIVQVEVNDEKNSKEKVLNTNENEITKAN